MNAKFSGNEVLGFGGVTSMDSEVGNYDAYSFLEGD